MRPQLSHIKQIIGTTFQPFCSVESGSVPLFFEWSRNGQSLKSGPEIGYKIDNSEMFSIFTIKTIDTSDVGNYSCRVRNAFGSDTQTVLLSIKGIYY